MHVLEPRTRRWTKAEYYRMAEMGWFHGQRVELIEGEIVVMSPQSPSHFAGVDRAAAVLRTALGTGFWVRMQGPIDLGVYTEPEPDVSVVRGTAADHSNHPKSTLLIVEVSESPLAFDRREKLGLYARAGVPEYWILNLVDDQLEVHRDPSPDGAHPNGFRYAKVVVLRPGDSVTPLAVPQASIPVASLIA